MSRSPKLGLSRRLKLLKQFITIFRLARPSHGHAVLQGADPNAAWAARFREASVSRAGSRPAADCHCMRNG